MFFRWILASLVMGAAWAWAQPVTVPASRPAVAKDGGKAERIARCLAALADADAGAREAAREELIGLRREDLGLLRAAAADARPLAPSQAAVLREIVVQAYLTGEAYDKTEEGFLGIKMSAEPPGGGDMQVVVASRLPGFCGYRYLLDGDVLLDIEEFGLSQPMQQQEFLEAVRKAKSGQTIHLKVLRQGQRRRVAVKLDARPAQKAKEDADDYAFRVEGWVAGRQEKAEAYWKEQFAPLLEAGLRNP